MQIELVKVGEVVNDGKYAKMDVFYIREGKAANRKLVSIGKTKDVMQELTNFKAGDIVDVDLEKVADPKDATKSFYNWVGIKLGEKQEAATVAKAAYVAKSTYETPEERARKQVYIVRQSSLANAIEFLGPRSSKVTKEDVFALAEEFSGFVFQTYTPEAAVAVVQERAARKIDPKAEFEDDILF